MESTYKPAKDIQHKQFAQVLVPPNIIPKLSIGELILEPNMYAVSYEDSSRKIPEWASIRLSPRESTDMHGTARTLYTVALKERSDDTQSKLNNLIRDHEEDNCLSFEAVHNVSHFSEQNSANGKGRIIRL